jgi:hypothetical protein
MTRREFVARTMATTAVIAGAPAFLRGQNLNNKLHRVHHCVARQRQPGGTHRRSARAAKGEGRFG